MTVQTDRGLQQQLQSEFLFTRTDSVTVTVTRLPICAITFNLNSTLLTLFQVSYLDDDGQEKMIAYKY